MRITGAAAIAVITFSSQILAQGQHEHVARGMQHHHHHARDAKPEKRDGMGKRAVETVTHFQYVTVDQDGVPWETQGASAPLSLVQEAQVLDASPPQSYSVSIPVPKPQTTASQAAAPPPASSSSSTTPAVASQVPSPSTVSGLEVEFPDNSISCSQFPSNYGAMALDYLGHNGWTGIQLNNADTDRCESDGALCSYACPPGYSKSQWPADQPADGQSRGGLLCQNGKLVLTRPSVKKLCVVGQGSAQLVNKMSKNVAVCRTDYPGTENMVIPVSPAAGATEPLTVVISADYYIWGGKETSAQYYVNKAGVSPEDGCIWGTLEAGVGNFAPLVFGAGYKAGDTWISMFANPLANGADAGYDVKIVATEGSTINGDCSYVNGQFSTAGGCTVCVTSGSANFVFTERS